MARFLRSLETRVARLIPRHVYERRVLRDVVGLLYHTVAGERLPHIRHLYAYKNPAQFEADLRYLAEHYQVISYPELVRRRREGAAGPPPVILTFDDGLVRTFRVARPLLLRYGFPCTFFAITGSLDNQRPFHRHVVSLCISRVEELPAEHRDEVLHRVSREAGRKLRSFRAFRRWVKRTTRARPDLASPLAELCGVDVDAFMRRQTPFLSRAQVRTLAAEGFTIGAHTVTHPQPDVLDPERLEWEIVESCREVAELAGAEQVPFAFPYSGEGIDRDWLASVRARHPVVGLFFDTGKLRRDRDLVVQRIPADGPPAPGTTSSTLEGDIDRAYLAALRAEL